MHNEYHKYDMKLNKIIEQLKKNKTINDDKLGEKELSEFSLQLDKSHLSFFAKNLLKTTLNRKIKELHKSS
jgi:hypothetical protein